MIGLIEKLDMWSHGQIETSLVVLGSSVYQDEIPAYQALSFKRLLVLTYVYHLQPAHHSRVTK